VLHVHDPRGTLEVVEYALRHSSDPYYRQQYLGLAMWCGQRLYSLPRPMRPACDAPIALVKQVAIHIGVLGVLLGEQDYLAVLSAYAGIPTIRERDALAEILYLRPPSLVYGLDGSAEPMRYLAGALHQTLAARDRQAPQAHMTALDDKLADEMRGAVVAAPGIDVQEYVGALRATGRAADRRLARDTKAWLGGAPHQKLGDAAYRRMLHHLRGPRSRASGASPLAARPD